MTSWVRFSTSLPVGDSLSYSPSLTNHQIDRLVTRYTREMARYEDVARLVEDRLRRELRANTIRALLSSRAKHPEDLRTKLERKSKTDDERYGFTRLDESINSTVTDLAGCRVMLYRYDDIGKVKEVVRSVFQLAAVPRNVEEHAKKDSGYRAIHVLVELSDQEVRLALRGALCEIQVTSLAAHVFNEIEHDIGYKDHGYPPTEPENLALQAVRWHTWLLDRAVAQLEEQRARAVRQQTQVLEDAEQLKFALEQGAGRPLYGEFERLFHMLDAVVHHFTVNGLNDLGDVQELLARGHNRAQALGLTLAHEQSNDVVSLTLALMSHFGEEFSDLVRSWRGPATLLKKAVLKEAEERGSRP